MANGINVGGIESFLRMRDDFTATFDKYDARLAKVEQSISRSSKKQTDETAKIKQAYDRLAASLDPLVARQQKYERSVETLDKALKANIITHAQYNSQLGKVQSQVQQTVHWTDRLGRSVGSELTSQFGRFFAVSALITTGVAAVSSVTRQLIEANIDAEATTRRVEEAVRRYGQASGVTADQIDNTAQSISRLTGLDDELIADAEVFALKFNRIGAEIFPRVSRAAVDLSIATGIDLSSAFEKVGKIVNQPLRGLTLLNREGYAVGKSQSDMTKEFLRANDIIAAQGVMLGILEGQYGGAAEAARDTLGGALTALGTTWENFLERIGEDHTSALREGIESLITILTIATDHVDDFGLAWSEVSARVNAVIAIILDQVAQLAESVAALPALFGVLGIIASKTGAASDVAARLRSGADAAANESMKQQMAIVNNLTNRLGGLSNSHGKVGRSTLEWTDAESKLNRELEKTSKAVQDVAVDIGKLLDAALDQAKLYDAAVKGQQALNAEILKQKVAAAILREEEKLRAVNKSLTEQQRKEIETAIRATDKFKSATDALVASWSNLKSLSNIELKLPDFSKVPFIEQSVMEVGVVLNPKINEEFETQWLDFAEAVEQGLKTDLEALKDYELQVKIARDLGYGNAIMWEEELARVRQEKMSIFLSDWVSFANTLGNLFGGLFEKIANALNSIQSAYDAGNQLGGMLQKYAGAGSWASGLGMYAAAFTAFYELTKALDASELRQRGRRWTSGFEASARLEEGSLSFGGGGASGEAAADQLKAALDGILEAIGGFLAALPDLEIQIRNDGKRFRAVVAGIYLGTFNSIEEALGVAIQEALSQAEFLGVGTEVLHVLELAGQTLNMTLEELSHNLDVARQTQRIRIGDVGAEYVEMIDGFLRLIEAQKRLGLSIDGTIETMNRSIEAEKARRLGIDLSTSQALADLRSLNEGMAQASSAAQAAVQREIDATLARIATLEAAMASGVTSGGGSGGSGGRPGDGQRGYTKDIRSQWESELADLRQVLAQYIDELDKIPAALTDFEINMGIFDALYRYLEGSQKYEEQRVQYAKFKVEMEFLAIKQQLILLQKWEEFQAMYTDAYNAAMAAAGKPVRGGSGRGAARADARESALDQLADLAAQLDGEIASTLRNFAVALEDWNKAAKEGNLTAQQRAEGERLLRQEMQQTLRLRAEDLAGITTDFVQKLEDGVKFFNDLMEVSRKDRGMPDWYVNLLEGKFLEGMGQQFQQTLNQFIGFTDPFLDIEIQAGQLRQGLVALAKEAGWSADRVAEAEQAIAEGEDLQKERAVLGIFAKIYSYLEDTPQYAEQILQFKQKELDLEFLIIEAQLKAVGMWDDAAKALLDAAKQAGKELLTGANAITSSIKTYGYSVLNPITGQYVTPPEAQAAYRQIEEARDLLSRYQSESEDGLSSRLREINNDFIRITTALGNTAEIIDAKNEAIEKAMEDAFSGLRDTYTSLLYGSASQLPVEQQYQAAMANYERILAEVANQDYSELEDLDQALQTAIELAGQMFDTSTGGFASIRDKILQDLANVFAGAGIELPSGLGLNNIFTSSGMATVLEFAPPGMFSQDDKFGQMIKATDNVASVVDSHGTKQETLLRDVATAIRNFQTFVQQNGGTLTPIQYGMLTS